MSRILPDVPSPRRRPVALVSFRREQVTEGNIAVDDDLTTPVFSQHSGWVIKLIAKLGDHVEAGAPLFEIQATEFVQAQNDLITALANLQTARSRLAQAGPGRRLVEPRGRPSTKSMGYPAHSLTSSRAPAGLKIEAGLEGLSAWAAQVRPSAVPKPVRANIS